MLDREEKVRTKIVRTEKLEEERKEQLKAAVKPKEVVESVDVRFFNGLCIMCVILLLPLVTSE